MLDGNRKSKTKIRRVVPVLALLSLVSSLTATAGAYERPRLNDLISVGMDGQETTEPDPITSPSHFLGGASASRNGRFIAFASTADNLVPGDTNRISDIFVRDRVRKTTKLVSTGLAGIPAVGALCFISGLSSFDPAMSADGRYVAFRSYATNLVAGDVNGASDVFRYDRRNGVLERVTTSYLAISAVPLRRSLVREAAIATQWGRSLSAETGGT